MTSEIIYTGDLRTKATHIKSGEQIITDAPTDNHGLGQAFSPTDLCATSLVSCMFSIMGIKSNQLGLDIKGSSAKMKKIMASNPRRISAIEIEISMKGSFDERQKKILTAAAETCPVLYSLHPDIKIDLDIRWP